MIKAFFDTNIILDLLLDRQPFSDDIAEIFTLCETLNIQLCVSSLSIANINYIIGRIEGKRKALSKTKIILELVKVENIDSLIVNKAAKSKFKDFEDGIQYYCAFGADHSLIVTRNLIDFVESDLSILSPKELLVLVTKINEGR